jgi:hypothetical protein
MTQVAPPKRKSVFYAIFIDIMFTLLTFLMLRMGVKSRELSESQALAGQVPGLESTITVLSDKVEDGRAEKARGHRQGIAYQKVIRGKEKVIGNLAAELDKLNLEKGVLTGQVGSLSNANAVLQTSVDQLTADQKELQSRFRSGAPVTVVVMIDVTVSMQESIDELLASLAALCQFMPITSEEFRVGIVAFRQGVVAEFPITRILPKYEDRGQSQQAVLSFVDSLNAERALTDHLPVFKRATEMLKLAPPSGSQRQKEWLVLLGDTGPAELDGTAGYNSAERARKDLILRDAQQWVRQGQRAFVSLYAESDFTKQDPAAEESRQWFESLGKISANSKFYTAPSKLLVAILHASQD